MYVSNFGHFRDVHRQPIPQYVNDGGYMTVQTAHGFSFAHRIVMKTWRPVVDMDHLTVDHLDHNKRDNSVYNLEWVTGVENKNRARADKLSKEHEKQLDMSPDEPAPADKKFTVYIGSEKIRDFSTLVEASEWAHKNNSSLHSTSMNNIQAGINKSIKGGQPYATQLWRYE